VIFINPSPTGDRKSDQRQTEQDAEHNDGRYDGIRQGKEDVRRDVEAEEVDRLCLFDLACTEERGGRPVGKSKWTYHDDHQSHRPKHEQDAAALQPKRLRVRERQPAERGDQGDHHIGDHGDLQQRDERITRDLEEGHLVAKKDADQNADPEADKNLGGDAEARLLRYRRSGHC
jgi:hypothetical protein